MPSDWWPGIDTAWHDAKRGSARSWRRRAREARRRAAAADRLNDAWSDAQHAEPRARKMRRALESGHAWPSAPAARRYLERCGVRPVDSLALHKRAWYADGRARTLALGRSDLVATCGQRKLKLRCACGPSIRDVGCGQVVLCDKCRRGYYRRVRRRALKALDARLADARRAWAAGGYARGQRPGLVHLILTCPHDDAEGRPLSLVDRHRILVEGWRRFRQWLHRKLGGAFAFVGLPELAAKRDPRGHLHYHFVVVWPWWDWSEAIHEWRRATGLPHAIAPEMRGVPNVKTAAHYVGKYATKGVDVNGPGMSAPLVGEWVAAYYGKRRVLPSVAFWEPRDPPACPCCAERLIVTERPARVVDAAASWRAMLDLRHVVVPAPPIEPLQVTIPPSILEGKPRG